MIKLIKKVKVFSPKPLGVLDVLIADGRIAGLNTEIDGLDYDGVEVIDGRGKVLIPGFIDGHVHILGGGGEGGYRTRTPELMLSDLILGGVSTVVGCLGTDGISRSMESLVAKAYALREEGASAYIYTGSYRLPLQTLTGSVQRDLILIDPIIGVGEIAISDHRSSVPLVSELARVAADARVGGILSGKCGLVNIHLGDGKSGLGLIQSVLDQSDIPKTQFLPTHTNRNQTIYNKALEYALSGGYIDFTTSTVPQFIEEGEVPAAEAYVRGLEKGVSPNHMTFTSDGQGSLPRFDDKGILQGLDVGKVTSLYETFISLIEKHGLAMELALIPFTQAPAERLNLKRKGSIAIGMDGDFLLLDQGTYAISDVFFRGTQMMKDGNLVKSGTFERI